MNLSSSQQEAIDRALLALTYYETVADNDARLRGDLIQEYGRDYVMESLMALVAILVMFNKENSFEAGMTMEQIYKLSVQDIRTRILALVSRSERSDSAE